MVIFSSLPQDMPVERKFSAEQQRRNHARPSWSDVYRIIDLRTAYDDSQNQLLPENRLFLRDYFDAVECSARGSYRKMRRFRKQYEPEDQPTYDPRLRQHMGIIRSVMIGTRRPR